MIDKSKYNEVGGGVQVDKMFPAKDKPLQVGDSVEGRYIDKQENAGKKGNSNIYVVETSDGTKVGIWGTAVLDGRFQNIAKGKVVAVEYLGIKKSKKGDDYKDFFVGVGIDVPGDEINLDEVPF